MAKPIINKITPFDSGSDHIITMSYFGDMAYSNKITIYHAEKAKKVFEDTVDTFALEHTIPAFTLQNGVKYAITAQVFDRDGIASTVSDKQYFWCFKTPSFHFKNLVSGDIINSASYNSEVTYEQEDWEDISSYKFQIYNEVKTLLDESVVLYDADNISYSFRGLENGTIYYIRCAGITVNGMELDTGYVEINVQYENPNTYARIYAECDRETGIIHYRTNYKSIESSTTEQFQYNNGIIDLNGKSLVYHDGFLVENDFTMIIRGRNLYKTGVILAPRNENYGFTLSSYIYDDGKLRFKLIVPNGIGNYIKYSDDLTFDDVDMVTIVIKRVNNLYSIYCNIEYGYKDQKSIWFGSKKPSEKDMEQYDVWLELDNLETVRVDKDSFRIFVQDDEPNPAILGDVWIGGCN